MPDQNKLARLRELGFKILPVCGICAHADLRAGSDWGACKLADYKHGKHSAETKVASIHRAGSCLSFAPDEIKAADLERSGFSQFSQEGA